MARTMTGGGVRPRAKKTTKTKGGGKGQMKSAHPESAPRDVRNDNRKTDRPALIRETIRKLKEIDVEREGLNARRSEVINIYVKGHLGMKVSDFNAAIRLANLEGEDRAEFLGTMRETFGALRVGDQLDFLSTMEEKDREVAARLNEERTELQKTARAAGREAGFAGKSQSENPHPPGSAAWKEWDGGHREGLLEALQDATKRGAAPAGDAPEATQH